MLQPMRRHHRFEISFSSNKLSFETALHFVLLTCLCFNIACLSQIASPFPKYTHFCLSKIALCSVLTRCQCQTPKEHQWCADITPHFLSWRNLVCWFSLQFLKHGWSLVGIKVCTPRRQLKCIIKVTSVTCSRRYPVFLDRSRAYAWVWVSGSGHVVWRGSARDTPSFKGIQKNHSHLLHSGNLETSLRGHWAMPC